ncbi:MAG: N-acetylmuramic acid 6-phosphate etherase [Bacteroidota bacterium]
MPELKLITESPSNYRHLEKMTVSEILKGINTEDKTVPAAIALALPQIENLVTALALKMKEGGRLFYIGAGTSGRLGMVDASECPPTFGVEPGKVVGIIAGGYEAMFRPIEFAEDNTETGWSDLRFHHATSSDFVIGITASGTTPYVLNALNACRQNNILTGCICSNPSTPVAAACDFPVEVITGPEFVTGSTRMKSGTAQKLVLNMISTTVMIQLGRVEDNKMVNMQLTNQKLLNRGARMLMEATGEKSYEVARALLLENGSVSKAVKVYEARQL